MRTENEVPLQAELLGPLMEVLKEHGHMDPREAASAVADKLCLPESVRKAEVEYRRQDGSMRRTSLLERQVRWTRQNGVLAGLISREKRGVWELSEEGRKKLTMARPGVVYTVITTDLGAVLWAEAMTAFEYVEDGALQLIFGSPPFPLCEQREYGGWGQDHYVETLLKHLDAARRALRRNGSVVVNLADVYIKGGEGELFTYQEQIVLEMRRRGWHLCGKEIWFNPRKPKSTPYTTQKRNRLAGGFECFFWWSPSTDPVADNRRVLEPYGKNYRKRYLDKGGIVFTEKQLTDSRQRCPGRRYAKDNGGRIPFNVVTMPDEGSGGSYIRRCKELGLPFHPARMPIGLARHWVNFTTEAGDIVMDPFGGSLTTAAACQELGRHFISSEKCLEYIIGGKHRFDQIGRAEAHWDFIEGFRLPEAMARAAQAA